MKFLLVCLVGLLVSVHANPVSPPVISGQVRLPDGSPVAGAQVVLFDVADLSRGAVGQATTDETGLFALPLAADAALVLPREVALGQNYPNPFNPSTIIPYQLASPSLVRLEVFNILGQRVATLVDGEQEAGVYRARWDGTAASGGAAAAGVYIYRLTVDGVHWTGKMVLLDGQAGVPLGGARVEMVSMAEESTAAYGLVVSGAGLVAYVDADFGVGIEPVAIELAEPQGRGKVSVPTLEGMLGDVNVDGRVDLDDGLLVAMYSVDPALSLPNHGLMTLGDVNCDGRVELGDAGLLATYVVHPSDASVASLRIGQRGGYSLDPVTEMVWGSILGTEKKDATVARLLDEVPVLISGVMPIDGKDRLYLGIDQTWWDEHGGKHIYEALKQRFPATPIHVEPSIGVVRPPPMTRPARPAGKPTSQAQEAEEPAHLFLDTFEDGLDGWQAGSGWEARSLGRQATIPGEGAGNIVARAQGCSFCFMTLIEPVDLSAYESVTLSFYRWMDADMGDNEFLGIDIGNNGSYRRLDNWDKQDADGQWHLETFTLTGDDLSDAFTVRFFGITRNAFTTVAIDNVMIAAAPGSIVVEPVEPEEPEEPEEEEEDEPDTLDDFFNFFDDEDEAPTLTVTNMFAFPRSLQSGGTIFVGARVTNTGDDDLTSQTVNVYRHTTETATPRVGGVRETNTATIGTLAADTSRNVSVRVTAPAVAETTQIHYYICISTICADTPTTVTIQPDPDQPEPETPEEPEEPEEPEPTEQPLLTITKSVATPPSLQSTFPITLQTTVTNTGNALAPSQTIRIYRHVRKTATPTRGGTQESGTALTGTIAPGTSVTVTSTHTAPTVTSTSRYYYYVCVADACINNPAEVVVRVKPGDPGKPPYINCFVTPERNTPMGGDAAILQPDDETYNTTCGTITLGGLETTTGEHGFVISGHVAATAFDPKDYTRTDAVIGHSENNDTFQMKHFLGRLFRMPTFRSEGDKRIIGADAAFAVYPTAKKPGCSLTWSSDQEEFCLDPGHDDYIERLAPLAIRGAGSDVYTVTGSQEPTEGLGVRFSGAVTGTPRHGVVGGDKYLSSEREEGFHEFVYSTTGELGRNGDSGSPVYTTPNASGTTYIVGILIGSFIVGDNKGIFFSSWSDVTQGLNLKPVGP